MEIIDFTKEYTARAMAQLEEEQMKKIKILEEMIEQVKSGDIEQFVACSVDESGVPQLFAAASDGISGIGLFEMGKFMIIELSS